MAKARILATWTDQDNRPALYHCVSRVVDRRFIFRDTEREHFVQLMRKYETFCGIRILAHQLRQKNKAHLTAAVIITPTALMPRGAP